MKQLLLTKNECEVIEKICKDEILSFEPNENNVSEEIDSYQTIIRNYEKLLNKVKEEQFLFNNCELELIAINLEVLVDINPNSNLLENLFEKVLDKIYH